jgi:hypothetical protein
VVTFAILVLWLFVLRLLQQLSLIYLKMPVYKTPNLLIIAVMVAANKAEHGMVKNQAISRSAAMSQ